LRSVAFLSALACALVVGCAKPPMPLGGTAPGWSLPTTDGDTVSSRQFEGRPGLIAWIDPICPQVQEAAMYGGALRKLEGRWMSTDSAWIVYVSSRSHEEAAMDPKMWRPWMKEMRLRGPVLVDGGGALARSFGVARVPDAVVLDGTGRLRWRGPLRLEEDSSMAPLASDVLDSVLSGGELPGLEDDVDTGCPILPGAPAR
jgi:hypothetical protein